MQISPIRYPEDHSSKAIRTVLAEAREDVLVLGDPLVRPVPGDWVRQRMADVLRERAAGLVFADGAGTPRIDCQRGSIRDDFDLGPVVAVSVPKAREVFDSRSGDPELRWGGLYDLRLRLSEISPVVRIPEPLVEVRETDSRATGERVFDYVDPSRREYQVEMERVVTAHLGRIGACLSPRTRRAPDPHGRFPVTASVVIPVRNRESTIRDAISSALSQETTFDYNVIVVDNHSEDLTGEAIESFSDRRVVRIIPEERHLGIGGCWNVAVFSSACGRIAVQLDSDDLYADSHVLAELVGAMERNRFAMLVAAYTTVDFDLNPIAPGLVDHSEWTAENGHNNILRVNGFGAPRVFDVGVLKQFGFPNVSYGEDYAVGLRISREYEVGRIFDSVYQCRRWEGNSDSQLPAEVMNRFNSYKDWLRTMEIEARTRIVSGGLGSK